MRSAFVRTDGTLLGRREAPTRVDAGPDAVIADAIELLSTVRAQLTTAEPRQGAAEPPRPIAIGISAPGPLDPSGGRLLEPPNLGPAFWSLSIADRIASALELPAVLERDTNVALLGELGFGAARGARDVLYLTVSTGIGGSVLTDGRLLSGPDGAAGELGHVVVDFNGPVCGCGARGHLEAFSSGVAIARAAHEAVEADGAAGLAERARQIAPTALSARDVADLELAGDPIARAIMETARAAFAAALVSFVDVFAPELIVIGGGIAQGQGGRLLDPAREAIRRFAFRKAAARVRVVPAALGDDVGLVGALGLVALRFPTLPAQAGPSYD